MPEEHLLDAEEEPTRETADQLPGERLAASDGCDEQEAQMQHFREWTSSRIDAAKVILLQQGHPDKFPRKYWLGVQDQDVARFLRDKSARQRMRARVHECQVSLCLRTWVTALVPIPVCFSFH